MFKSKKYLIRNRLHPFSYLLSLGATGVTICIVQVFHLGNNLANVYMCFLLAVIVSALRLGRAVAVIVSFFSFLAIDYFFVEPKYTLVIAQPTEWLALTVFILVATITGQLTALLRAEVDVTQQHDKEMTTLAETSWEVASVMDSHSALSIALRKIAGLLDLGVIAVITAEDNDFVLHTPFGMERQEVLDVIRKNEHALRFVQQKALPLGPFVPYFPNSSSAKTAYAEAVALNNALDTFLPIRIDGAIQAIVYLAAGEGRTANSRERQILQALVNHIALILQREKSFAIEAKAQALLEADKLKSALLSMISHDFRSPLTSIKASIQTLRTAHAQLPEEEANALFDTVENETDRLNRMVKNILDLSRLEADAWRPKCELIPLSELIGSVLSSLSDQDYQRILLSNQSPNQSAWLDSVQMVQVIHNLLENALKYSQPETKVELSCESKGGKTVITVSDRGIGLPKEDELNVFEPFYRGAKLSETSVPGAGIGLSICKGLVEAHGGRIEALRREGGGSVFRVTLPNRQTIELPELIKK